MSDQILQSFNKLKAYCEKEAFKGYDPYDSLNSTFLKKISLVSEKPLFRLAWTQFFKRSPLNFRKLAGVNKDYNPKALGLFLSGYCNLYTISPRQEYLDKIDFFSQKLIEFISPNWKDACWGYNFDWQARAFFQPKNTPTVVATSYISNALLDAYEITGNEQLLTNARSACNFILKDLNRTYDDKGNYSFSYSPLDKSVVFNASLLGSSLLARVYSFTQEKELIDEAKKSVDFCCDYQNDDGSWSYGTLPFHKWVDNFHTGYNLECISDYMKYSKDYSYKDQLAKGFDYYIHTFFTGEGIPKYYNNSVYPIDIHSSAQLVITLVKLNKFQEQKELLNKVLNWTIENMQSDKGYFYYQINKYFSSKIPYMRWAQAWMFYSLSTYLKTDSFDPI
jgi:rhamnogalacturonyl hydrolase YesR